MNATPSPTIPELPKAAAMLDRVREEAAELRSFTITFLSLLLYVAIIISSTTHEQILRIDPVKLPLLGVDIPIVGFYWFMPGFLFFLHLYLLLQHYLFSQLAHRFHTALERETEEKTKEHLRSNLGNLPFLHWLAGGHGGLMNFLMTAITLVSLIIWPVWTYWWLQATFLPYHDNTIVWTQRAFLLLDAALLAYLWAKILDAEGNAWHWWKPLLAPLFYGLIKPIKAAINLVIRWLKPQHWLTAWTQRQWPRLLIDWLRPRLSNGAAPIGPPNPVTLAAVFHRLLLLVFLLIALFFSFFVSVIPGSAEEKWLLTRLPNTDFWITNPREQKNRRVFALTAWLHEQWRKEMDDDQRNDYAPERRYECRENGTQKANDKPGAKAQAVQKCYWIDSPFPRNLILREKLLTANKGLAAEVQNGLSAAADTSKVADLTKAEGLNLQGRHLEYSDFSESSLPNADLRRARLKAANFFHAKLEKVHLEDAELPTANLSSATLSGANLSKATLSGANLSRAQLPGANLKGAELPGADLTDAQLTGANLDWAILRCADLSRTQLTGANLSKVNLTGVILQNINFAPMNKEKAKAETDKLNSALKDLPWYHGDSGQAALSEEMDKFRQKITRSVDFTKLRASEGCLAEESVLKDLPTCRNIVDPPEAQKNAYEIWVRLACEDDTEKQWVAQRMIKRAEDSRFPGFAPLLAAKLQTLDKCPGLASLDDELKKALLYAAKKTP